MGFFDADPQRSALLASMAKGMYDASKPSFMPLGFAPGLIGGAQGLQQGQDEYLKRQLEQQRIQGGSIENQSNALNLQSAQRRADIMNQFFPQGQQAAPMSMPSPQGPMPDGGSSPPMQGQGAPMGAPVPDMAAMARALAMASGDPKSIMESANFGAKRELTPQEVSARGLRGSWQIDPLGNLSLLQASDAKSPEAIAQEKDLKLAPSAPSAGMSDQAFQQQKDLKQTPGALTPGLSDKAFEQQIKLKDEAIKAQLGDAATMEEVAKNIASYKSAPLSGFAMAKPGGQAIMARVTQINPQFNAQNFTKSQQAYKDFGSGKKGDLTRSFNVSISHLGTLEKLTDALGNGDVQAVNQLSNTFKEQFGSSAPTNFNAAKAIVGDEIIKAIVGSGGALADRENAQNQISAAKTPAQLKGVIKTYKELMAGQLKGLKQQYEQSTMRDDFDTLLSPESKAQLENAGQSSSADSKTINGVTYHKVNGQWMQ